MSSFPKVSSIHQPKPNLICWLKHKNCIFRFFLFNIYIKKINQLKTVRFFCSLILKISKKYLQKCQKNTSKNLNRQMFFFIYSLKIRFLLLLDTYFFTFGPHSYVTVKFGRHSKILSTPGLECRLTLKYCSKRSTIIWK